MTRLQIYVSSRIIQLLRTGVTSRLGIQRILRREGFNPTYNTIRRVVNRYNKRKSLAYKKPGGKLPSYPPRVPRIIDRMMMQDNELTSPRIKKILQRKLGCNLSLATINRIRRNCGWVYGNSRYCQFVRPRNKHLRYHFAKAAQDNRWKFRNVVFTDECTVMLDRNARKSFRKATEARLSLKAKVKHAVKLHIWAGISWFGPTSICIFDGTVRMNSKLFCRILRMHYLPFQRKYVAKHGRAPFLQMDNDPKHTSAYTVMRLRRMRIRTMRWPAESPDMNAIENVWHQLKTYLRRKKPLNKDDLKKMIKKFWKKYMTVQQCRRYINHIHQTVVPIVVANSGAASGK